MNKNLSRVFAVVCALVIVVLAVAPAMAQSEMKEKPPMYTYVGDWAIPRAQWGEMEKANAADQPTYEKAFSGGTIVGYGNDVTIVHQGDGQTHDEWWSAMSMAGLLNVLEQFYKSGFGHGDKTLGRNLRQPVLQLEAWLVEGYLYARGYLQVEARCPQRCGGDAQQESVCSVF